MMLQRNVYELLESYFDMSPSEIYKYLGWSRQRYSYAKQKNHIGVSELLEIFDKFAFTPTEIGRFLSLLKKQEK